MDKIPSSYTQANKSSYFYPIFVSFIIPVVIGLFAETLFGLIQFFVLLLILFVSIIIVFRIVYDWTSQNDSFVRCVLRYIKPIPPGLVFGTDLKIVFPAVTIALIMVNTAVFFTLPAELVNVSTFLPYGDLTPIQVIISFFSSAFFHGDLGHLLSNMIFLWVFGNVVESRIGPARFLFVYFLCLVMSNLLVVALFYIKSLNIDSISTIKNFHSLGASGAIAGIIGIFTVRCFFAKISFSLPFFIVPFLSIPVKLQAPLLIALFFAMNLAGSKTQYIQNDISINYWAHVGGYIGGFLLGYLMKLHKFAAREAVEAKADRLDRGFDNKEEATKLYNDILKQDPENEPALRYFLKHHKYNEEKAGPYFSRLIHVLIKKDFTELSELLEEYFPRFVNALSGSDLFRVGSYFYQKTDYKKARVCLEMASEKEGPWQPKALLMLSSAFEELGNLNQAKNILEKVIERFPNTPFQKEASDRSLFL